MHTHSITTADDFVLEAQVSGPAEAPALLLLQGQANAHEWWDGLRDAFEPAHRTVTFDYRGTGGSRGGLGELSTTSFASDTIAVLDGLGIDRAAVYGTSMGGRIAQMIAIDHPERTSALVLACTTPGGRHSVRRPRKVGQDLSRRQGAERRAYLHTLFYTPAWPGTVEESRMLGDETMTTTETAAHLRISANHSAWDRLPEITAPTLITHGDADLMNPVANAHLMHERIAGSRISILPGARHGFFEEFEDVVTPEIAKFLDHAGA